MFLHSTFSIQLRYIIVMCMFSSACAAPLDMRMRQTILLEKMTIKKFLSHFSLIEDFYILVPFHLQDSLLLFSTQFGINGISYQFKNSIHIVYRFISKKILQYRSCHGMKRKWDKYWKNIQAAAIFVCPKIYKAECSSNNRETWDDFQKVLMILIRHTKTQETIFFIQKKLKLSSFLLLKINCATKKIL